MTTNLRFLSLTGMVLIAALSRIIPHPDNVAPIAAMALFGGAYFSRKSMAFLIPFLAMVLSDLFIGFHRQIPTVYLSFALTVMIGFFLRSNKKALSILWASLGSSVLFFLITNLGVWLFDGLYPHTMSGLGTCYTAAIPFFRNSLFGDLLYAAILFGSFSLAERRFPSLQEAKSSRNPA